MAFSRTDLQTALHAIRHRAQELRREGRFTPTQWQVLTLIYQAAELVADGVNMDEFIDYDAAKAEILASADMSDDDARAKRVVDAALDKLLIGLSTRP